ncbi:MAG: hypothetical protein WAT33_02540 [Giesbergeria sp.]|nr:hypothetical protein [Simplicispira sp.]
MIFAVSPGTPGCGEERFIATLPFRLSPGSILQLPDESTQFTGTTGRLTIERLHHLYAASLGPYPSTDAAEQGLAELRAAVLWCAIEFSAGVRYPIETGAVNLFDEPITIPAVQPMAHIREVTGWTSTDGRYEAGEALVRPDHKRLVRFEFGQATVTAGIPIERFVAKAEEALSFKHLSKIARDEKLKLAIEVAMSHRFEASDNAQFITLITSLEALLPDLPVSPESSVAITEAAHIIRNKRDTFPRADPEWSALARLLGRIDKLRADSIGEGMRSFINAALERHPGLGDRQAISKQVLDAYNARSRLLHDGHVSQARLSAGLDFLRDFVPRLLRCLFREAASA